MCVCVSVLFSSVSFLPLSLSRGFYTLQQSFRFPFFFFIHKNFHREVFQVYPKKTAIPALVNSWFASLLSLYFAINIVGLLAPIASGIQLVFSPPFQADTQSGKNSRPNSTSFSFFKVLTILFLIFAAIRTGKSCSKWSLQSVYPKKLTRKRALLAAACLVLLTLKLDCLKMCVCLYQRCVD